jgi:hypothetical protein
MFWLRSLLATRITPDSFDRQFASLACFAAGPAVLYFGVRAIERFATTPGEIVIGLLSAGTAALALILIGLVLPQNCTSAH